MRRQCDLLGVPRSGIYRFRGGEPGCNFGLMRLIDQSHTDEPTFGSPRITAALRRLGHTAGTGRWDGTMDGALQQFPPPQSLGYATPEEIYSGRVLLPDAGELAQTRFQRKNDGSNKTLTQP